MDGQEIKERIDKNNARIDELLDLSKFTLNKEIRDLLQDNQKLRKQCPHEYDDKGRCIYCDMTEEE